MSMLRLDKLLSSQLNISRSDAKKLIRGSKVILNGTVAKKADVIINPCVDIVLVNGKTIEYKEFIYLMLNKPKGVVSASNDNRDVTVIDILPEHLKRSGLFPAGRLDKDTTGFVLITDNGEFAHNILSPSHHVKKTYLVQVARMVSDTEYAEFINGMKIGDEIFKPAELKYIDIDNISGNFVYEIKIIEGRYHQIKRMFASSGNAVLELKRIAIGSLFLDDNLQAGEAKELSDSELELIYKIL